MLLPVWHDQSDVKLAEALDDRSPVRRLRGISGAHPRLERTTFVRFRKALTSREHDEALLDDVTSRSKAKAVRVKTGTPVDASVIASAGNGGGEAQWVEHRRKPAVDGFEAHVVPTPL